MKHTLPLIFFLLSGSFSIAQTWDWVETIRPGGNEYCWDVANDPQGNILATGRVKAFSTFGSGAFAQSPPPKSLGETDAFLAKYRPNGDLAWVSRDGGVQPDWGRCVATDAEGNVFITGDYCDTAYFGTHQIIGVGSSTNRNVFLAKYDSSGVCLWAKTAGNAGNYSRGYGVTTDSAGNSYITGHISGVTTIDAVTFGVNGFNVPFIAKFDPAGTCLWAKRVSVTTGGEGNDIRMDAFGHLLVAGSYRGTLTVAGIPHPGNSPAWGDVFLLKLDQNGTFIWAQTAIGQFQDQGNAVDTDSLGNVYMAGTYAHGLTFGTTVINAVSASSTAATANARVDGFVVKYDKNGVFKWVKTIGNVYDVCLDDIQVRNKNKIVVAGFVRGAHTMFGVSYTTPDTNAIGYVTAIDSSGNIIWNKLHDEDGTNATHRGLTLDQNGTCYVGGEFVGDPYINFDSILFQSTAGVDGYIARLDPPLDPVLSSDKVSMCLGDSVHFNAFQDGVPISYSWTFAGGTPTTSSLRNPTIWYAAAGNYDVSLVVSNMHGSDTLSYTNYLAVNDPPSFTLGPDTSVCQPQNLVLDPGTFIDYLWDDMSTTSTFTVSNAGTYSVMVTDTNSCSAADTVNVSFTAPPMVTLGSDTILCDGQTLILDAGTGFDEYLWNDGSGSQTLNVTVSGPYSVTVQDIIGCSNTDTIAVTFDICTLIATSESLSDVSIYPNPASGFIDLFVGGAGNEISFDLFDYTGRHIRTEHSLLSGSANRIDLTSVSSGVYFYVVTIDSVGKSTGKIILTK